MKTLRNITTAIILGTASMFGLGCPPSGTAGGWRENCDGSLVAAKELVDKVKDEPETVGYLSENLGRKTWCTDPDQYVDDFLTLGTIRENTEEFYCRNKRYKVEELVRKTNDNYASLLFSKSKFCDNGADWGDAQALKRFLEAESKK